MSELKPCPCCGTPPEIVKGYEGVETICCPGCGIRSDGHYPTDEYRRAAYAKWNARAVMPDDIGLRKLRNTHT